jgi:hypothetical protein
VRIQDSITYLFLSIDSIVVDLSYILENEHWITCVQIFSNEMSIQQGQILSSLLLPMCLTRSHSSINYDLISKYYFSIHTQLWMIHSHYYSENLFMMCWINERRTVYSANDTALTHLPLPFKLSMRWAKEFYWCHDPFTRDRSTVSQSLTLILCSGSMSIDMHQLVAHDSSM